MVNRIGLVSLGRCTGIADLGLWPQAGRASGRSVLLFSGIPDGKEVAGDHCHASRSGLGCSEFSHSRRGLRCDSSPAAGAAIAAGLREIA